MKQYALHTVILLTLTACGNSQVDPALQPFLDSFMQAGNIQSIAPLTIKFGSIATSSDDEQGECNIDGIGNHTIIIDQNAFNEMDSTHQQLLVWHELGHCLLGRSHRTDLDANGNAVSIMYPDAEQAWANFSVSPYTVTSELFDQAYFNTLSSTSGGIF